LQQSKAPKGEKIYTGCRVSSYSNFDEYTIETIIAKDYHPSSKENK